MGLDLRASELEHNFIRERVNSIGKHFEEISSKLNCYIEKLASVRDSGDDVAKSISSFASKEICNKTLRLGLGEFSDVLLSIQEYRDAQIIRTQVKVLQELKDFTPLCKETKIEIKKCYDAQAKELKKKNDLEKARSKNSPNWQKIVQVEKEVNIAQDKATQMTQEMRRVVEQFERKKLENLQHIFLEFIKIEMIFHARAIELTTKAFNLIKDIKVEEDLHEFNSYFKARLDAGTLSPIRHATVPKTVDANIEHSPPHTSHKTQTFKGLQGTAHSVFALKTAVVPTINPSSSSVSTINSGSSSKSFIESHFEPSE